MNIIVAITVVLKCAPECIKMQHVNATFRRRKYKRQTPQTTFLDTGLQELSHSNIIQIVKRQIVTVHHKYLRRSEETKEVMFIHSVSRNFC